MLLVHTLIFFHRELYVYLTTTKSGKMLGMCIFSVLLSFLFIMLFRLVGIYVEQTAIFLYCTNGAMHLGFVVKTTLSLDFTFIQSAAQPLTTLFMVFITALYYTVAFSRNDLLYFICYIFILFVGSVLFLASTNLVVVFVGYECILAPSAIIIYKYAKTVRAVEASYFMVFWTQLGAMVLFLGVGLIGGTIYFFGPESYTSQLTRPMSALMTLCIFFGFATKMPLWPFAWWLPEAHVEVGTNFSIVLSGVSIKLAFLGFVRFINQVGTTDILGLLLWLVFIGLLYHALMIDVEVDLKKIVAAQTVVEMHATVCFFLLDPNLFGEYALYLLTGHCWVSTIGFIIVDIIMRRYHTRNIENLYGVFSESPRLVKFIFFVVFILNSVPGALLYTFEFLIISGGVANPFSIIIFIVVQFFVAVWSKNVWWTLWGGDVLHHSLIQPFTFTKSEFYFICVLLVQLIPPFIGVDMLL